MWDSPTIRVVRDLAVLGCWASKVILLQILCSANIFKAIAWVRVLPFCSHFLPITCDNPFPFACVYVHTCMYMYTCLGTYVCMCLWRTEINPQGCSPEVINLVFGESSH